MIGNMILLGIVILLTWLLYRFPLRRAKSPGEYRKLLLFFGFLTIAALFNGVLAYLGMGGLQKASSSAPVTTAAEVGEKIPGDGIIVVGEVSAANESNDKGAYVAYTDERGNLWSPKHLWIRLKAGTVVISNTTYRAIGWPIDAAGNSYLLVGQKLIIVGFLGDDDVSEGKKSRKIQADIVFAGSHDDFVARARLKLVIAKAMLFANVFVAILIILFMLPTSVKGMRRGSACANE